MKRILVIYTGGTIGMVSTPSGYAPEKAAFHDLLDRIPELHAEGMPAWDIVDMEPLLDSSNITVREWNAIGALIADHYADYDGFVVLHGTDTMAYTASALSFMLRGNGKPVILTGSQIPLCEIRNDARDNIITSLLVAASDRIHEVCLYFGGKLLRGNRAIKYSADDLIAFESPNYPALADVGIAIRYNVPALLPPGRGKFAFQPLKNIPIGVIKVFEGVLRRLAQRGTGTLICYYPSEAYTACLNLTPEVEHIDTIDCGDLFNGKDERERIEIYRLQDIESTG